MDNTGSQRYIHWPCICGDTPFIDWWHRLFKGHPLKLAVKVNKDRRLVAADGTVGAEVP